MKRSEINAAIQEMIELAAAHRFPLPPFAHWTPEEWRSKGPEFDEIRTNGLGWDVTDFGQDDFARFGLTLLTIRNGDHRRPEQKPYCEKLMVAKEGQVTPLHFHWNKTEDIINRGGGNLVCRVYRATEDGELSDAPVELSLDGQRRTVPAGTELVLTPGQSVTLTPNVYHDFWAEVGTGAALLGEVSAVNDDANDNRFHEPLPRFPGIEEDAPPLRLLCNEYPPAVSA
jgi:D-lyxose ketol-isomerase